MVEELKTLMRDRKTWTAIVVRGQHSLVVLVVFKNIIFCFALPQSTTSGWVKYVHLLTIF